METCPVCGDDWLRSRREGTDDKHPFDQVLDCDRCGRFILERGPDFPDESAPVRHLVSAYVRRQNNARGPVSAFSRSRRVNRTLYYRTLPRAVLRGFRKRVLVPPIHDLLSRLTSIPPLGLLHDGGGLIGEPLVDRVKAVRHHRRHSNEMTPKFDSGSSFRPMLAGSIVSVVNHRLKRNAHLGLARVRPRIAWPM